MVRVDSLRVDESSAGVLAGRSYEVVGQHLLHMPFLERIKQIVGLIGLQLILQAYCGPSSLAELVLQL